MKNIKGKKEAGMSSSFWKKSLLALLLFALILPLAIKVFMDTPSVVADYLCNSYQGMYPTATTVGIILVQIVSVLAEMLRAGMIGYVLCVLLYFLGRKASAGKVASCLSVVLLSPIAVSAVGIALNYFCVSAGISRDTLGMFRLKLPSLMVAAAIEYLLYGVLVVLASLILYSFARKNPNSLFEGEDAFFPRTALFRAVTVSVAMFGLFSLVMTVSDTVIDFKTYSDITDTISGIMGYLVLPYLYLILKLASMLLFASLASHRMDRIWNKSKEAGK